MARKASSEGRHQPKKSTATKKAARAKPGAKTKPKAKTKPGASAPEKAAGDSSRQPLEQRLARALLEALELSAIEPWAPDTSPKLDDKRRPQSKIEALLATEVPSFLHRPQLIVDHHFPYRPDFLIFDPGLGTLAPVVILEPPSEADPADPATAGESEDPWSELTRDAVANAAYLCHLVLAERERQQEDGVELRKRLEGGASAGTRPPAVELVLVLPEGAEEHAQQVGEALRRLARDTELLHAIGVGLIYRRQNEEFLGDASLRRAFPWLLRSTRSWLETAEQKRRERVKKSDYHPPLLCCTDGNPASKQNIALGRLEEIELRSYRLAQKRCFQLDTKASLHLLHGHNGSGKSTLVEAFELVLTGEVERIESRRAAPPTPGLPETTEEMKRRAKLYDAVIRRRGPEPRPEPEVELRVAPAPDAEAKSKRSKSASPRLTPFIWRGSEQVLPAAVCDPPLYAASFRLDQTVMDRLAHQDDAQRALLFLRAFFPEEQKVFRDAAATRQRAEEALAALPEDLRQPLDVDPATAGDARTGLSELGKLLADDYSWAGAGPREKVSKQAVDACLPVDRQALHVLQALEPEIEPRLTAVNQARDREGLEMALTELDHSLETLLERLPVTLEALKAAIDGLEHLDGWQATGTAVAGSAYPELLDDWLEAVALADLADRHRGLVVTQRRAWELGWRPPSGSEAGFLPRRTPGPTAVEDAERYRNQWRQRRDELFHQMQTAREALRAGTGLAPSEGAAVRRPSLTASQVAGLNQAGPWLGVQSEDGAAQLGKCCRDAVEQGHHMTVGGVTVGTAGWEQPLLERAGELLAACNALLAIGRPPTWSSGHGRLSALTTAVECFVKLAEQDDLVATTFLRKITEPEGSKIRESGLDHALNEVMALFTPARWAYGDLRLTNAGEDGQGHKLRVDERGTLQESATGTGGGPEIHAGAELRLNTAELNVFTLALFLLCAPRLDNPLRLMVLDDPLQNMDELTVTTLARGMARLAPVLLQHGWQLLMLFHGEDDLDRFRHQLPDAAVYRLPWLRPLGTGEEPDEKPIEAERQAVGASGALMDLQWVIREDPHASDAP